MESIPRYRPIRQHLIWLLLPPTIWAVHFLASYITIAVGCAKADVGTALQIRWAVGGYTLVALLAIASIGFHSYRQHRHDGAPLPHDGATREDQLRFIGFATLLLAALSVVATVFTALVVVFIGSCD